MTFFARKYRFKFMFSGILEKIFVDKFINMVNVPSFAAYWKHDLWLYIRHFTFWEKDKIIN